MLRPRVVILLGATAVQSVLGKKFRVTQSRGKHFSPTSRRVVIATVHPSSLLRAPTLEARRAVRAAFVADMRVVARHHHGGSGGPDWYGRRAYRRYTSKYTTEFTSPTTPASANCVGEESPGGVDHGLEVPLDEAATVPALPAQPAEMVL